MTTAQLIARYRQLIAYDLDSVLGPLPDTTDAVATAAYDDGVVGYLNEAMTEMAPTLNLYDPAVSLALTPGQARYKLDDVAFSARILTPYSCVLGGVRLRSASYDDYAMWTLNELTRSFPTWASDPAGTTTKAVFLADSIILHPAPSTGGTAYFDARIAPPPLSLDAPDDSPQVPDRAHPAIAMMAVYASCLPYSQTTTQAQRLTALQTQAQAIAQDLGRIAANERLGNASTRRADVAQGMWM